MDEFGRCIPPTNRFLRRKWRGLQAARQQTARDGLEVWHSYHARIPRGLSSEFPIAGRIYRRASAAARGDTNRTCVWNHDMFGVDTTADAARHGMRASRNNTPRGAWTNQCDDIADMFPRDLHGDETEVLSTALRRQPIPSSKPVARPVTGECQRALETICQLWASRMIFGTTGDR